MQTDISTDLVERKKSRILFLAVHINPEWISLPLQSWYGYSVLRKDFSTHLVTRSFNAPALRRAGIPEDEVTYIDLERLHRMWNWFFWLVYKGNHGSQGYTLISMPIYWLFEIITWFLLKSRIKGGEFSAVVRLSPVSPIMGSPIAKKLFSLKIPFIVGPLNGGLPWPKGYPSAQQEKEAIGRLRKFFGVLPFVTSTFKRATAIIVGSSYSWIEISRKVDSRKVYFIPENGIPKADVRSTPREPIGQVLKVCFIGRLVPLKNCNLTIASVSSLIKEGLAELEIVGDGPERNALEALAKSLGVDDRVKFHGMLPHKEAMEVLASNHVLAFPSIREFGGGVVVEAMSRGVVPIVMQYGGPGDLVDPATGVCLPLTNEEQTGKDLESALRDFASNQDKLRSMSEAARLKARDVYAWEGKAKLFGQVINHAVTGLNDPGFKPTRAQIAQYQNS